MKACGSQEVRITGVMAGVGVLLGGLTFWSPLQHDVPTSRGTAAASATASSSATTGVSARSQVVQVTHVIDGDTFVGKSDGGERVTVRLLGIDAPEVAHGGKAAACGADEATGGLAQLIAGSPVVVATDPRSDAVDRYGRVLGYVAVLGEDDEVSADDTDHDVALQLVRQGLAEAWYPKSAAQPTRHLVYKAAQERAQKSETGSWATCTSLGRP